MKLLVKLFFVIVISITSFVPTNGQSKNIIGYSFGGYVNFVPKYNLPGNQYHPFLGKSSSSCHGFGYERILTEKNSLQTGVFLNQQFSALMSLHVPVNYNYCIYQLPYRKFAFGSTLGINLNVPLATSNNLFEMLEARYTYSDIELDVQVNIKKRFYVAPHVGLWINIRPWNRIGLSLQALFHFPVSEYVQFVTSYRDVQKNYIVEQNTNKNFGVTVMAGIQVWLGKIR
jgi:hypothetical protein